MYESLIIDSQSRAHIQTPQFSSHAQNEQNMQFGTVADIYIGKQYDEMLIACNVNQWELSNRGQRACSTLCKFWSLII